MSDKGDRALVKNAADPDQLKDAKITERDRRRKELDDLCFLLGTPQGRRFIWRLLGECKTFETVWEPSARIHYNAGRQDLGHFLMAEIAEADQGAFLTLMQENYKPEE